MTVLVTMSHSIIRMTVLVTLFPAIFIVVNGHQPLNGNILPLSTSGIFRMSFPDVKDRLKIPPVPMNGFELIPWLGPWYFQFHKAPCSWSTSEGFTDFTKFLELQGNKIINLETMRSHGLCNSVSSIWDINGSGEFTGVDPVGGNWNGKIIMVDTDYKAYYISYGCTKWSLVDNTCEDPGLYIKTRKRNPHPEVLRRIDTILQETWGISINQLKRISHNRPCSSGGKKVG